MPPIGQEGTDILISFTPTEYGKALVGKLAIVTEDMQWTYRVFGSHPTYHAPDGKKKVTTHHTRHVSKAYKNMKAKIPRNYMREQMHLAQKAAQGYTGKKMF